MTDLLTGALEAHNPGRNHHRRYQVAVGRDWFGDWTVEVRYGRCGRAGRGRRTAGPAAEDMQAVVRDRLRRRLAASRPAHPVRGGRQRRRVITTGAKR